MALKLQQISDLVNRIVIIFGVFFVVTMLILSTIGITYQLVFSSALTWSYSLTRLFLPWLAMLSLTVAFKSGEHVAISMAIKYLSDSERNGKEILFGHIGSGLHKVKSCTYESKGLIYSDYGKVFIMSVHGSI